MNKPSDAGNVVTTTGNPEVHFYTGYGDAYAYIHVYNTDIWVRIDDMERFCIASDMVYNSVCRGARPWDVIA